MDADFVEAFYCGEGGEGGGIPYADCRQFLLDTILCYNLGSGHKPTAPTDSHTDNLLLVLTVQSLFLRRDTINNCNFAHKVYKFVLTGKVHEIFDIVVPDPVGPVWLESEVAGVAVFGFLLF